MVYIKRIELSHFKSFGGTTQIPLLPGFTVISGPNGSGKSNILDALLFALGLSSSKGMRAERLPDLVNQTHSTRGRATVEASVTVTFDLEGEVLPSTQVAVEQAAIATDADNGDLDPPATSAQSVEPPPAATTSNEWSVTRKLRVTQQGTYTSTYYINGEPCTLSQLHEQLNRLRIYPEGYNVVLQGDVTGIISMNPRDRRQIIDELAGVAAFDRKIDQARSKLDAVKEREDRCRIIERELIQSRDRLAQDRLKAEKYQQLRQELQTKEQWEGVIHHRHLQQLHQRLTEQIAQGDRALLDLREHLAALHETIRQTSENLEQLNAQVKALGEEELLALQSTLATQEAEQRQLQRQQHDLATAEATLQEQLTRTQQELQECQQEQARLEAETASLTAELATLQEQRDRAQAQLSRSREGVAQIAAQSEAWVERQTTLYHQVESLQASLGPQRQEQAFLQERANQLARQIQEQMPRLQTIEQEIAAQERERQHLHQQLAPLQEQVRTIAARLSADQQEWQLQQETQARLLREQREKQRQLDKLEAQTQALRETQGTHASQVILQSGLPGLCGLVAQLGRVDARYQLALETAAGARLGHLVVEDDAVAAAAIALLKERRAGRATFLPLNKLSVPATQLSPLRAEGAIDYAVNLIDYDRRYATVFAYVFGQTVVFADLETARRHLGRLRMVTLDGELLETSGAMTGGSQSQRGSGLHFGTVEAAESVEVLELRERLGEIDRILNQAWRNGERLQQQVQAQERSLTEARQQVRELELRQQQAQTISDHLEQQRQQLEAQLAQYRQEQATAQERLHTLDQEIPKLVARLQERQHELSVLETSQTHREWQERQAMVKTQEADLQQRELALRVAEQRLQDLALQQQRLQAKGQQTQQRQQELREQQTQLLNQGATLSEQQAALSAQIQQTQAALAQLEQRLGAERANRDRLERQLRELQTQQQQQEWQIQKLLETQQARQAELATVQEQREALAANLPDPLPEVPTDLGLEQLQQELRSLQKRIQAMEPVNMLALEEYDRVETRLAELSEKLATLESERTELLLRVENFTTLRQRAFMEAYNAVDANFRAIFAELSEGDGHLQLDDPDDPFNGGLNLVAHPKGKPVRRLASMSGGEKSLTALSFIFALQRYRPSPFYSFDEVDMFLDGANVERLARMIRQQAQQAQFIVVSLRRPMIEASERTIGVTQARGAHTQVLGITLEPKRASQ
ncbi:chromosome segregation protein SMC [Trichothermofontia sichuanensis B231]|uniref:chromosome segregation protein SMC n=1 Tax=Trichothermofontia sichuanensis TaxID=3045816 RepID=UPI00224549D0|nr:chromosome segregation protein SMC [Trichothermofontia sichuanensis]UZQ53689.1 chromosome segregation protein SMC [Trichothermofontia sichuanensis B231]